MRKPFFSREKKKRIKIRPFQRKANVAKAKFFKFFFGEKTFCSDWFLKMAFRVKEL